MTKKIITLILSGILTASLVSCSNKQKKNVQETPKTKVEEVKLEGSWAKDYSKEEVAKFNSEIIKRLKDLPQMWDVNYKEEEVVKEENGETVKNNNIHFDNLNPQPNRIESLSYAFKIYGSDMSSGNLELLIAFNLGRDKIKEEGTFDMKKTSLAGFSECFTGNTDRDYSEINSKIYNMVKDDKSETKIENNVDGLQETITVRDNVLMYKLQTKKYNFKSDKQS